MPFFHIRQAQARDQVSWLKLRHSLWPHCSEQKHRLEIEQLFKSKGAVFVAENDQRKLIAFAEVSLRHDHVDGASICPVPYLEAWFVAARFRGQGVGRSLMKAVERWATTRGYSELASDAELHNSLSIRLHRRLGFSEMDRNVTFLKTLRTRTIKNLRPAAPHNRGPLRTPPTRNSSKGRHR